MRTDNFDKDGKLLCRKCGEYKTEDHFSQIKIKNIGIIKAQNVRNVRVLESKNIEELKKLMIYLIMLES